MQTKLIRKILLKIWKCGPHRQIFQKVTITEYNIGPVIPL